MTWARAALLAALCPACHPGAVTEPAPGTSDGATVAPVATPAAPASTGAASATSGAPLAASSSVADGAAPDPCDERVAQARRSEPLGLVAGDRDLDPGCQWRVDDASEEATRADLPVNARLSRGPGILRVNGRIDPTQIGARLKKVAPAVDACVKTAMLPELTLRVRLTIDAGGSVSLVQTDYRYAIDPAVRECVARAVGRVTFPKPEGGRPVTAVYGFALKAQ